MKFGAGALGTPSGEQQRGLEAFWRLLLTWNARINLTGARSQDELVGEHLPDALAMGSLVPQGASVVDVGAGGGLPGVAFAVLRPDTRLTLVEPRAKRVAFLRTAVRELGLSAEVVDGRMEDLGAALYDVASSRATFAPAEWIERARVLAPRTVVFAARRTEVALPGDLGVEAEEVYQTASGHPRWAGLLVRTDS
jgi:16S rRNA (guanine527-N7)-methyltransferase